jgi:serine/threonine-protein kinase RsbW
MSNDTGRVLHERLFQQVTPGDLATLRNFVRQAAGSCGLTGEDLEELVVAVNEAMSNIVRHGFHGQPADIKVVVVRGQDAVEVILRDRGPAFDPQSVPAPDRSLPLAERPFGGMGVQLMRELCDELRYQRDAAGRNELRLLKRLNNSE